MLHLSAVRNYYKSQHSYKDVHEKELEGYPIKFAKMQRQNKQCSVHNEASLSIFSFLLIYQLLFAQINIAFFNAYALNLSPVAETRRHDDIVAEREWTALFHFQAGKWLIEILFFRSLINYMSTIPFPSLHQ